MSSTSLTLQAGEKKIKMYVICIDFFFFLLFIHIIFVYRLICCGVKGQIKSFVKYLEGIYVKKGLFDYVFCIGDFFGDDEASEREWKQFLKSNPTSKE